MLTALAAVSSPAFADNQTVQAKIVDHYETVTQYIPNTITECNQVQVPVYGNIKTQGDAGAGALMGMIVGGIIGKGVSGDDDGAAAGAVLGGIIGANEATKPQTQRAIIGYTTKEVCNDKTTYAEKTKEVYSYSSIEFKLDGAWYMLNFER